MFSPLLIFCPSPHGVHPELNKGKCNDNRHIRPRMGYTRDYRLRHLGRFVISVPAWGTRTGDPRKLSRLSSYPSPHGVHLRLAQYAGTLKRHIRPRMGYTPPVFQPLSRPASYPSPHGVH